MLEIYIVTFYTGNIVTDTNFMDNDLSRFKNSGNERLRDRNDLAGVLTLLTNQK